MKKIKTKFKDFFILKSKNNYDLRGHLREIYNQKILNKKFIFDFIRIVKKILLEVYTCKLKIPKIS